MKHHWKDWFTFSTRERQGLLVLVLMLVAIHCARLGIQLSQPERRNTLNFKHMHAMLNDSARSHYQTVPGPKEKFHFNPNDLAPEKWKQLGLNERQVSGIVRFRNAGGTFRFKEDIQRVYSLDSITAESLMPYIDLPSRDNGYQFLDQDSMHTFVHLFNAHKQQKSGYNLKLELNEVDTAQLKLVPGIGGFYARNIIKYRNALGGFADTLQLLEVWKMTPAKVAQIHDFFTVDQSLIKKINVNTASVDDMRMHPYLTTNQAKVIVAYREKHGSYRNLEDLRDTHILPQATLSKLEPYLDFGPPHAGENP